MHIFDSHAHLQDPKLLPGICGVIERAVAAGVTGISSCGTSQADWPELAAITKRHECIFPSFGLHPWFVGTRKPGWDAELEEFLKRFPSAGVGETGLDSAPDTPPMDDQMKVFLKQLDIARRLERPVSIHCRNAWPAMLAALRSAGRLPGGFMIHSCSASSELIGQITALGGYISFSGSITRPANKRGRRTAAAVPLNRLLIETDSPDIIPLAVNPDAPNEPSNLTLVLQTMTELRSLPTAELAGITTSNALALFQRAT
jgi:TatD DNase family protein